MLLFVLYGPDLRQTAFCRIVIGYSHNMSHRLFYCSLGDFQIFKAIQGVFLVNFDGIFNESRMNKRNFSRILRNCKEIYRWVLRGSREDNSLKKLFWIEFQNNNVIRNSKQNEGRASVKSNMNFKIVMIELI